MQMMKRVKENNGGCLLISAWEEQCIPGRGKEIIAWGRRVDGTTFFSKAPGSFVRFQYFIMFPRSDQHDE